MLPPYKWLLMSQGKVRMTYPYSGSCTISTSGSRKQKGEDPQLDHTEMAINK